MASSPATTKASSAEKAEIGEATQQLAYGTALGAKVSPYRAKARAYNMRADLQGKNAADNAQARAAVNSKIGYGNTNASGSNTRSFLNQMKSQNSLALGEQRSGVAVDSRATNYSNKLDFQEVALQSDKQAMNAKTGGELANQGAQDARNNAEIAAAKINDYREGAMALAGAGMSAYGGSLSKARGAINAADGKAFGKWQKLNPGMDYEAFTKSKAYEQASYMERLSGSIG